MCKSGGWQNSQASEVKTKNMNTIKTSNKLNVSFSSPRLAANSEFSWRRVWRCRLSLKLLHWVRQRGSRLVNYSSASLLHSSLWWAVLVRNLGTGQNMWQNKMMTEKSVLISPNTKLNPEQWFFTIPYRKSANVEKCTYQSRSEEFFPSPCLSHVDQI